MKTIKYRVAHPATRAYDFEYEEDLHSEYAMFHKKLFENVARFHYENNHHSRLVWPEDFYIEWGSVTWHRTIRFVDNPKFVAQEGEVVLPNAADGDACSTCQDPLSPSDKHYFNNICLKCYEEAVK